MSEALANNLRVNTLLQQEARVGMPQVVPAHLTETRRLDDCKPGFAQVGWIDRAPYLRREYQPGIFVVRPKLQPFLQPPLPRSSYRLHGLR